MSVTSEKGQPGEKDEPGLPRHPAAHDIRSGFQATLPDGGGSALHHQFLRRAEIAPNARALQGPETAYSYGELRDRAAGLASALNEAGLRSGSRIAILAERGPELVWSMLAVSLIGGVFIVLDAGYPDGRLETLAGICKPDAYIVTREETLGARAAHLARASGAPVLVSDAKARLEWSLSSSADLDLDAPAYFLFTSGSTGVPKCVAVSHRPLTHFIEWHTATFGLSVHDRFSMLAGLSHDPLLRDVFTPLSIGATLIVPRQDTITQPGELTRWFKATGVTVSHLTPPMGQLLVAGASKVGQLDDLRLAFWGGDRLPQRLVDDLARLAPGLRQTNFYGSTETPQAAAFFRCEDSSGSPYLPVGRGSDGFQLLVMNEDRQPVDDQSEGEVAVRSNYLSLGYVSDGQVQPATDRGRDSQGRSNIYYTGDRGRYLSSGDIMVLGRADDQVKIRGYRVDLSEVTAALLQHPGVAAAATVVVGEALTLRIIAFATRREGSNLAVADLMAHLAAELPSHMAPAQVRLEASLPLLVNGKVDRQRLLRMAADEGAAPVAADPQATEPASDVERALIAKWREVMVGSPVAPNSSFAALGGDSLSYVQVYLATEEVLGVPPAGWQTMTISELAAQKSTPSRLWTVIDTPMLIRAAAIVLVVAGHLQLLKYGDGATTALFLVSGFLFGGLQLQEVFRRRSPAPILKSLINVLIPVYLYALFAFGQKAIRGKHTTIDIILLNNDLIDYTKLPLGHSAQDYQIHLWYVDALIKIIFFAWISLAVLKVAKGFRIGPLGYAAAVFVLGCFCRFLLPGLFDPGFFVRGVEKLTAWNYAPTAHLGTFALGLMVANVSGTRAKAWLSALVAVYAVLTARFYGLDNALFFTAAAGLLLWANRVRIPKPIARLAFVLSGASLFIYLTHYMFGSALRSVINMSVPALETAAGLVGGVIVWRVWTWMTKRASLALNLGGKPAPAT